MIVSRIFNFISITFPIRDGPKMTNLFFTICFFLLSLLLLYRIMTNSKRLRETQTPREKEGDQSKRTRREKEGEATDPNSRRVISREKEGEASSGPNSRRVTSREKEGEKATSSDRLRKEATEVVEGMYIFYFLFKKKEYY